MSDRQMRVRIKLWHVDGAGIIIPGRGGIVYTNQAGGSMCAQPELEGSFFPIREREWVSYALHQYDDPLRDFYVGSDQGEWYKEMIPKVELALQIFCLDRMFRPATPEEFREFGQPLAEAWVPMVVRDDPDISKEHIPMDFLSECRGRPMILTYENSD